jgi:hypothetical protein
MRRISVLVAFVLAVGAWAGFAAPASAQYSTVLTCNFTMLMAGDTATVSGDGYDPGSQITISINRTDGVFTQDVLITTADANGQFTATFTVPAAAPAGTYDVLANGIGVDLAARSLACPFEVGQVTQVPIAFTGSNSRPMAQIALAIIALGALLVFATRRKRDEELPVDAAV